MPLGINANTEGEYTINASEIYNMPAGINVYLVDTKKNITQDLTNNPAYSFDMTGLDDSRFYLKFGLNSSSLSSSEFCHIYSSDRDLFVNYNNPDNEQADMKIYTVTGQLLMSKVSITNGTYHTTLDVAPGVYLPVKVISPSKVYIQKVYIQ